MSRELTGRPYDEHPSCWKCSNANSYATCPKVGKTAYAGFGEDFARRCGNYNPWTLAWTRSSSPVTRGD